MTDAETNKWDFDEKGKIKTTRLVEWGVASVLEHIVLRIGYVRSRLEHEVYHGNDKSPHQVQVEISASAARELSIQLVKYADWLELKPQSPVLNGR